ncbi:MAG: DUF839 domain-containing protein [Bacteriovoracaceae bacterium]|nr:DUF839 domain-containing protein [Bacteriovoracaceae bacterium]
MENVDLNRRKFVQFMGGAAALAQSSLLTSCATGTNYKVDKTVTPKRSDEVELSYGLTYDLVVKWGDQINSKGDTFGFNNDYLAFTPIEGKDDEAILWANHEAPSPMFVGGYDGKRRTKSQVDKERYSVGGSLVKIVKGCCGKWEVDSDSEYGRRLTATTPIPYSNNETIKGKKTAIGTLANCAGGVTPWGNILTCEENYENFYGEYFYKEKKKKRAAYGWDKFYNLHPYQYGWVVEVNPFTGEAKKHTGIGRYSHECATCVKASDGRTVVYSGDDRDNEHIYKFISKKEGSLSEGELFVADIKNGKWLSLDINKNETLKQNFKTQLDLLIDTRAAAKMVGATPCDRPEDIEIQPGTANVFVALTNNKRKGNYHGSILRISEKDGDFLSMEFSANDFVVGGEKSGFSCPDNLAFDKNDNLWMVTDISGGSIGKPPYESFGNNGLFYIPMKGPNSGKAFQVGSAPFDAEFTGICFSPDFKTLFLSVQHPGEKSKDLKNLRSNWPDGGENIPRPSVIQVYGPLLDKLMS